MCLLSCLVFLALERGPRVSWLGKLLASTGRSL